ncbi:hypothetical protein HMPREF1292_00985 [Corynebacterium sp. KPL1995]|nr:hypothetical protein HMPREF1292_00985 [Corynebacterium sp. KPL1995]ERS72991.1 hypothetical protein HMPREF1290_00988 [Corynebacterium sp. KPL1989]
MIGELSSSADDASDLVKGLLQASINTSLQPEMDTHLGYGHAEGACRHVCSNDGAQRLPSAHRTRRHDYLFLRRGMTVRDICHHLSTTLGVDMSPDTISTITDEVMVWQNRQLDEFSPVIFLDALRVKIRDGHRVVNKACRKLWRQPG